MSLTSVDLLEELRTALDELEPLLAGRVVDIEMSRMRVHADPLLFRQEFGSLLESAVGDAEPGRSITVRVARVGKTAKIEVVSEPADERIHAASGSMTVPLAPGASAAPDA
jgi:hypothetical protein